MKIKRYQSGGVYYQPLVNQYLFGATTSGTQASQKSGSSDMEEDLLKGIQDLMKTNGLRSDLMMFNNSMKNIFSYQNMMQLEIADRLGSRSITGSGFNANKIQMLLGMYSDAITQAQIVQSNYKQYENAQKNLDEKGAWSNIAIDMSGQMWCMDQEGNLVHVSPEDYGKNQDKYQPLTNAQLMDLRANNPLFGSTNSSFGAGGYEAYGQSEGYHMLASVTDVVDDNDIAKQLQTLITNLGTTDLSDYGVKKGSHVSRGLEALSEASADGIYKIKRVFQGGASTYRDEKTGKEYTYQDLTSAINFLSSSLSNRQIAYLKAKGAMTNTFKEDPSAYVQQYILTALNANLDQTYDPELVENLDPELGGGAGGSGGKTVETTRARFWGQGLSMEPLKAFQLQSSNKNSIPITVYGLYGGQIKTKDGMNVEPMRFDKLITESPDFNNVDMDHIQFGDVKIDQKDLDKFVYNRGSSYRVDLPVSKDGSVNFEEFKKLQDFNNSLDLTQIIDGDEFKRLYNAAKQNNQSVGSEDDFARDYWLSFIESKAPAIAEQIKEHNRNNPKNPWMFDMKTGRVRAVNVQAFMMVQAYTYASNRTGMWDNERASAIKNSAWLTRTKDLDGGVSEGMNDLIGSLMMGSNLDDDDPSKRKAKGKWEKNLVQGFLIMPIYNSLAEQGEALIPASSVDYNTQMQRQARREFEIAAQPVDSYGNLGL